MLQAIWEGHMNRLVVTMVSATLGVALISPSAVAQTSNSPQEKLTAPQLFPEKTLAYLRVDDVAELKKDFARSSGGKLSNDKQIKPILMEFYGSLVRNTEQMQEEIGLNLDELLSIPSGEMAIALLPGSSARRQGNRKEGEEEENEPAARRADPAVAVLVDAGDEITSIQVLLGRIEESIDERMVYSQRAMERLTVHQYANPNRRREQFAYFIDEGVLVACTNADLIEQLANVWLGRAGDRKSLADNRRFTSIMARCVGTEGERPQVSFFVDPMAIVREFTPKNAATMATLAMLPALGLDGIEAVGGSWIIAPPDFDSISHFHLLLSSPRRSVLGLLRPKSGSTDPEDWIPDSVAAYSTINWDTASTLQAVERLYNQFRGPDALEKEVFERVNEQLQIDLSKDVLENLEGRFTLVQGFVRPVTINSGSNVYAVRLKNPEFFKSNVLPKVLDLVAERTEVKLESFGKLRVHVMEVGRGAPEDAPIRQPEICVTIIDDYVVLSDSKYMMRQIADCLNGTSGALKDGFEYEMISDRIAAQLQEKECSAISYARPEESLQLFYELARDPKNRERLRQVANNNGFFKALLSALDEHDLPPFSVIAKYLAPAGGFLVEEETGMHYMSFSLRRD